MYHSSYFIDFSSILFLKIEDKGEFDVYAKTMTSSAPSISKGAREIQKDKPRTRSAKKKVNKDQSYEVGSCAVDIENAHFDIRRLTLTSKKIIGKHVMGCELLHEVLRGVKAFSNQLPTYSKEEFIGKKGMERRMEELDLIVKWALQCRIRLIGVDVEGVQEIKLSAQNVVDR
jgi:hypothetical protein